MGYVNVGYGEIESEGSKVELLNKKTGVWENLGDITGKVNMNWDEQQKDDTVKTISPEDISGSMTCKINR